MPLYLQVCIFVSTSACASVLVCVSWPSADCVFDTHHNGTILYHLLGNRNQTINKMCQFAKHFPRLHFALTKKARKKKTETARWNLNFSESLRNFTTHKRCKQYRERGKRRDIEGESALSLIDAWMAARSGNSNASLAFISTRGNPRHSRRNTPLFQVVSGLDNISLNK